jgi:hypothetical protein
MLPKADASSRPPKGRLGHDPLVENKPLEVLVSMETTSDQSNERESFQDKDLRLCSSSETSLSNPEDFEIGYNEQSLLENGAFPGRKKWVHLVMLTICLGG